MKKARNWFQRSAASEENTAAGDNPAMRALVIGAIGVVFGDLGTSPLYTFAEAFGEKHGMPVTTFNILGVLSLVLWTLILIVAVKYVTFIMRADNRGEGGIMAMMAQAQRVTRDRPRMRRFVVLAAVLGVALFLGDGVITPSITVLSAVEGLGVAASGLGEWVVAIAVVILLGVFWFQRHGTGNVGRVFGPVMCLWFVALGLVGIYNIVQHPLVLRAFSPWYGIAFFAHHGMGGFIVLGAVVLCVTGAEALYADMGHFGRRPIMIAWYGFVMPGVMLNYLGQGAALIHDHTAASNPFYFAVPHWALYPMIGLATVAAVIASQAVISGAFSLVRQAISLGLMPRMRIIQTSRDERGQVYLPLVNQTLMILVVLTVIGFGSSNALAGAYGIAVIGAMAIDATLFTVVALLLWKWRPVVALSLGSFFIVLDLCFFGANTLKIIDGGWFPMVLAAVILTIMTTWARGRYLLKQQLDYTAESMEVLVKRIQQDKPTRIPGTAVFLTGEDRAPGRLIQHLNRHHVLQADLLLVTVEITDVPRVPAMERMTLVGVEEHITRIIMRYGFMQRPMVPVALKLAAKVGLGFDTENITYYVGRETLVRDVAISGMSGWRSSLFSFLSRNARSATTYYGLPSEDIVELGFRVPI